MRKTLGIAIPLFVIFLLGLGFLYYIDQTNEMRDKGQREIELNNQLELTVTHFKSGVSEFAIFVSGLRSYIDNQPNLPSAEALQSYVANQVKNIPSSDSLAISFLDTNHIFQYSFNTTSLTPNKLVGLSADSIRGNEEMDRLARLLLTDELRVFPPLNLVEGWTGLPINFRVKKQGTVLGYIAPIISLKSILDNVYREDLEEKFVYHFSTADNIDFDSERIYDNTKVYNDKTDPAYYKNFNLEEKDFQYTTFSVHDFQFKLGVAFKEPYKRNYFLSYLLYSWYALLILLLAFTITVWLFRRERSNYRVISSKNKELQNSNEVLQEFYFASSHFLKEPLRNIGRFSGLLSKKFKPALEAEGGEFIDIILNEVKQMDQILNDLLEYSTLIQKKELQVKAIDLNTLLTDITRYFQKATPEKETEFTLPQLPTIYANPKLVQRLFSLLIDNAVKFNNAERIKVEIGYESLENNWLFSVKDNGPGIPKDYHNKIFKLFQRLSRSENPGTGMGLALCKKIVEYHDGEIWLESQEGKGSTFFFTISKKLWFPDEKQSTILSLF